MAMSYAIINHSIEELIIVFIVHDTINILIIFMK